MVGNRVAVGAEVEVAKEFAEDAETEKHILDHVLENEGDLNKKDKQFVA